MPDLIKFPEHAGKMRKTTDGAATFQDHWWHNCVVESINKQVLGRFIYEKIFNLLVQDSSSHYQQEAQLRPALQAPKPWQVNVHRVRSAHHRHKNSVTFNLLVWRKTVRQSAAELPDNLRYCDVAEEGRFSMGAKADEPVQLGTMRPFLSVVIPAYAELENLRGLIPSIRSTTNGMWSTEILTVLPIGSDPSEICEIETLGARVIIRSPSDSFGDALRSGFSKVDSNSIYVITMDADGSHDPARILALMGASDQADVVVASRYVS